MSNWLTLIGVDRPDVEDDILGTSAVMRDLVRTLRRLARTNVTVLIRGESGSGKELVARLLHHHSQRSGGPFVAINCAALSESVLESELFGHEKGAFTGASVVHQGRFERANGGTLFLDEIGDTTPAFQMKLLRVLQEGEIERVGGRESIKTNARIIAATNRDLEKAVGRGRFRLDLYYRLNVIEIRVPPLRERAEDIPCLIDRILKKKAHEIGETTRRISPEALERLSSCGWPGNVRELENCILRAAINSNAEVVEAADLGCIRGRCLSRDLWHRAAEPAGGEGDEALGSGCPHKPHTVVKLLQKDALLDALRKEGWVQARAARALGVTPRQVGYALKRFNIAVKRY